MAKTTATIVVITNDVKLIMPTDINSILLYMILVLTELIQLHKRVTDIIIKGIVNDASATILAKGLAVASISNIIAVPKMKLRVKALLI